MSQVQIALAGVVLVIALIFGSGGLHQVQEGHLGLYWRGGALLSGHTTPGYHTMMPGITQFRNIQTTMQTDKVANIPCGTSGGVVISFDKVEVVNRLIPELAWDTVKNYTVNYDKFWIFDRVHHEINQYCSTRTLQEIYIDKFDELDEAIKESLDAVTAVWAPGVEIIRIRVTKPRIPDVVRRNYEQMESLKAKLKMVVERQKVKVQETETIRKRAIGNADKRLEVSKINIGSQIREAESNRNIAITGHDTFLAREKAKTDSRYYTLLQEAEANKNLLTEQYLEIQEIESKYANAKFVVGDHIPTTYLGSSIPVFHQKPIG